MTEGESDPVDLTQAAGALNLTEELYRIAVEELNEAFAGIRQGRFEMAKEGRRAVRDLADLSKALLEERRNVDKLRKELAGAGAGDGALDLGLARDEIGRRLARLRAARGD
ncbi:hypothetical protein HOY34_09120 [Xinfangfangia sp. D13-10-4-6]|uniref:hypothetical protein n=1 Tax=Pseudogemmobacter hezensis TaxID=2737662 RepID=UPI0015542126|nr:hypothetical protein [Pseudogemmobacter hezensis]NPD15358.1 hypothetical protein [Pseudogemmobacter hezensis]